MANTANPSGAPSHGDGSEIDLDLGFGKIVAEQSAGLLGVDLARIHDIVAAPLGRNGDP